MSKYVRVRGVVYHCLVSRMPPFACLGSSYVHVLVVPVLDKFGFESACSGVTENLMRANPGDSGITVKLVGAVISMGVVSQDEDSKPE